MGEFILGYLGIGMLTFVGFLFAGKRYKPNLDEMVTILVSSLIAWPLVMGVVLLADYIGRSDRS